MAWSIVGLNTAVAVASGNVAMSEPAGVASGDLLVACIGYRSNVAFTLPTDWILCDESNTGNTATNASGVGSAVMAYIIRGASAPALTFNRTGGNAAIGRIVAYRGVDQVSPFIAASAAVATASSTGLTIPTFTASRAAGDLVVVMFGGGGDTTLTSMGSPTGATSGATDTTTAPGAAAQERQDSLTTSGADTTLAIVDGVYQDSAGVSGNFAATFAGAFWHAGVAAIFKGDTGGGGGPTSNAQFFSFF